MPALEHAAAASARGPADRHAALKKKKTAAVFGRSIFAAFYIGEMARKAYPLTVYSGFENAAGFLAAAAPFADAEGVRRDAESLEGRGRGFRPRRRADAGAFRGGKGNTTSSASRRNSLPLLGGGEVNEAFMLCGIAGRHLRPAAGRAGRRLRRAQGRPHRGQTGTGPVPRQHPRRGGRTETRLYTI
jgi:hypothetical protein